MKRELISLLVPDYILEHFDYEGLEEFSQVIRIYLTEKKYSNNYPKEILVRVNE